MGCSSCCCAFAIVAKLVEERITVIAAAVRINAIDVEINNREAILIMSRKRQIAKKDISLCVNYSLKIYLSMGIALRIVNSCPSRRSIPMERTNSKMITGDKTSFIRCHLSVFLVQTDCNNLSFCTSFLAILLQAYLLSIGVCSCKTKAGIY